MRDANRPDVELLRPPLEGVRIIELAAIGPVPFCGMMLADHGAEVIRIDRPGGADPMSLDQERDVLLRSRRTITLDLKDPDSTRIVERLVETADGLIEGFRPGVAERLGLGPDVLMKRNPRLVYARMTGWGQSGPLSAAAGHDLNYISLSGCLGSIGPSDRPPVPPLNLIGDFGGGGMMLAFGIVTALLAARESGVGRVLDCSMADGTAAMMAGIWSLKHNGLWGGARGENLLDGGAPFYATYVCADGAFVAIGAIERQFFARLLDALDLSGDPTFADQYDPSAWPAMKQALTQKFASAPRSEWTRRLEHIDCCYSEVLTMDDVAAHEHNRVRGSYLVEDGMLQPRPAPRFEHTATVKPRMWRADADRDDILREAGIVREEPATRAVNKSTGR